MGKQYTMTTRHSQDKHKNNSFTNTPGARRS